MLSKQENIPSKLNSTHSGELQCATYEQATEPGYEACTPSKIIPDHTTKHSTRASCEWSETIPRKTVLLTPEQVVENSGNEGHRGGLIVENSGCVDKIPPSGQDVGNNGED